MKELIKKLILIQNELKVEKKHKNEFGGFKYRSAEDILEAVKPILAKYGILLRIDKKINNCDGRYYVESIATLTDGTNEITVRGQAREPLAKKGMDEAQITGASSTYSTKYALQGLFLIDETGADPDSKEDDDFSSIAPSTSLGKLKQMIISKQKENPKMSNQEIIEKFSGVKLIKSPTEEEADKIIRLWGKPF